MSEDIKEFLPSEVASMIDQSYLKPTMKKQDILNGIRDSSLKTNFASYCVVPCYLREVAEILASTGTTAALSTVIGFPHGNTTTRDKLNEIKRCSKYGVEEYDVVVNYSYVLSGEWGTVSSSIKELYKACQDQDAILKVIFENCYLTERHKITLCEICSEVMDYGFVKTSTGFGTSGATLEDVRLMREHTKEQLEVKAAGGIKSIYELMALYRAGATRFGSTNGPTLVAEFEEFLEQRKNKDEDNEPPF